MVGRVVIELSRTEMLKETGIKVKVATNPYAIDLYGKFDFSVSVARYFSRIMRVISI